MSVQTFRLPDLGEGLTDAEIVRWLVAEGDDVRVDQPVVEVETAKSVVEVPTPFAGRVVGLHGQEGEAVSVGAPLISVAAGDGAPPPSTVDTDAETAAAAAEAGVSTVETATSTVEPGVAVAGAGSGNVLVGYGTKDSPVVGRRRRPRAAATPEPAVPAPSPSSALSPSLAPAGGAVNGRAPLAVASPLVRRLAQEQGVDLAQVHGTGPDGLITRTDVGRAIVAGRPGPVESTPAGSTPPILPASSVGGVVGDRIPLSPAARAAAIHYGRSRAEIPEATIWVDVDATDLVRLREQGRSPDGPGPGLLAYLARFVVAALHDFPVFNARFDAQRQEIVTSADVNLALAVQTDRGLVVPAITGAQHCSIVELDERIAAVTARARAGRLSAAELSTGTFTLNNYGSLGVDGSAAIINHPQVAMLGIGRILDRPWVVAGEVVARRIAQLSFVFDHRIADGATAAGFVRAVADAIERPVLALARL